MYANRSLCVTFVEFLTAGRTANLNAKSGNGAAASNSGPSIDHSKNAERKVAASASLAKQPDPWD